MGYQQEKDNTGTSYDRMLIHASQPAPADARLVGVEHLVSQPPAPLDTALAALVDFQHCRVLSDFHSHQRPREGPQLVSDPPTRKRKRTSNSRESSASSDGKGFKSKCSRCQKERSHDTNGKICGSCAKYDTKFQKKHLPKLLLALHPYIPSDCRTSAVKYVTCIRQLLANDENKAAIIEILDLKGKHRELWQSELDGALKKLEGKDMKDIYGEIVKGCSNSELATLGASLDQVAASPTRRLYIHTDMTFQLQAAAQRPTLHTWPHPQ